MVVDDNGNTRREERVETSFVQGVRVIGSEDEQVDNVDDTNSEVRSEVLFELSGSRDDFGLELEPDTDEDDIGVDTFVDRVGFPDRDTGDAVGVGLFDGEENGSGSFRSDDEVDVVLRSETVLDDRDTRVGIGGEVDAGEVRREREDSSDESGVLVGVTVVFLTGPGRGLDVGQSSDVRSPRGLESHAEEL